MSTPTKTSVEMPTQPLTEAAKEAFHEALRDAESLGHPLCGPTARADARRSKAEALELIDRLADLASQPAGAGWMPIETAPKDGTDVYLHQDGKVFEGSWLEIPFIEHRDVEGFYVDQQDSDSYWMDNKTGDATEPTEWMAKVLPGIPARGQQEDTTTATGATE